MLCAQAGVIATKNAPARTKPAIFHFLMMYPF